MDNNTDDDDDDNHQMMITMPTTTTTTTSMMMSGSNSRKRPKWIIYNCPPSLMFLVKFYRFVFVFFIGGVFFRFYHF